MTKQVLIAGAGPTGLTLAIELARRHVGVRIVEKAESFFNGSRGDGLQPRTLEVFEDLGVLDAVLAVGLPPMPIKAYVGGEFVREQLFGEHVDPTPDVPYPTVRFLGQSRTEGILRDRLAEFGVHVELGTELVGFEQDDSGVRATVRRDGVEAGDIKETVVADYLVGADGGRSFVRKSLGIAFEGSTDESIRMLLGDVQADGLDHAFGYWFSAPEDPMSGIMLTPLSGGAQFQFGAPLDDGQVEASLPTLQAKLDAMTGDLRVELHDLSWSTVWRPNVRLAGRFRVGRVFIAGDAAHVHPPTGGQGLNTGVQDGYNLGWKLADGSPELLDSYEPERRVVAARVLGLSSELMRKYTDGEPDAHERGAGTRQLDISYRGGPLSPKSDDKLRAGDRAPDAPVFDVNGKQVRLFELFLGPHATSLVFGDGPANGEHVHRILPAGETAQGGDFVDTDGHAYAAYGASAGARVTIRPDGYVAKWQ
ncbi:FAD-dependent monooxygenase [Amycolatopsis sp.]|jgi:2-polyprenyl-6-methoxyphenol hydroxylase-like FAD-dependent oxidoreductase|uniref:FAD-dependent monooxygenase n=1 Tax=Amycolatopsis sp. TaxID=37632 RepID=UPI002DFDAE02|nr:FAD-dependent monooxygenase [Amycolatopsis sp.]